jgi:single-stranded DNA-specific DHH superfamily exonuclease
MVRILKRIIEGASWTQTVPEYKPPYIERLTKAINNREKVIVYGTGDREGICGISILVLVLRYFNSDVEYFVVDGNESADALKDLVRKHINFFSPGLMITLSERITRAACEAAGCDEGLAMAIGSKPEGDALSYYKEDLSLVGNVYQLSELLSRYYNTRNFMRYSDLVYLGAPAGSPLGKDENLYRSLGREQLDCTTNYGLCAAKAITRSNIDGIRKFITPKDNPVGALDNSRIIIEMLTTGDGNRAEQIAKYLQNLALC